MPSEEAAFQVAFDFFFFTIISQIKHPFLSFNEAWLSAQNVNAVTESAVVILDGSTDKSWVPRQKALSFFAALTTCDWIT